MEEPPAAGRGDGRGGMREEVVLLGEGGGGGPLVSPAIIVGGGRGFAEITLGVFIVGSSAAAISPDLKSFGGANPNAGNQTDAQRTQILDEEEQDRGEGVALEGGRAVDVVLQPGLALQEALLLLPVQHPRRVVKLLVHLAKYADIYCYSQSIN